MVDFDVFDVVSAVFSGDEEDEEPLGSPEVPFQCRRRPGGGDGSGLSLREELGDEDPDDGSNARTPRRLLAKSQVSQVMKRGRVTEGSSLSMRQGQQEYSRSEEAGNTQRRRTSSVPLQTEQRSRSGRSHLSPSQHPPYRSDYDGEGGNAEIAHEPPSSGEQNILLEVKELLSEVAKKVDRNERALKELKHENAATPSRRVTKDREKLNAVRNEVRRVYKTLEDEHSWVFGEGKSIKSEENKAVILKLVKEVKGLNPSYDAADIRTAACRFYRTRYEDYRAKMNGKDVLKKRVKRRHERIVRKRKERESAVMKNPRLTEEARKKWLEVCTNDMMSSEESGDEDSIIVHPLPWRSEYVSRMFQKIDDYIDARRSPQARRQKKMRRLGQDSSRPAPTMPDWAK